MTKANCKEIRRELDEMMLGDDYGVQVSTHLRECIECRDFQQKQARLRQIVGSLDTVSAPPDFDFKLRARLANENSAPRFRFGSLLGFGQRSAAVATALVLLIGGIVLVRYLVTKNQTPQTVATKNEAAPIQPELKPIPAPSEEVVAPVPAPVVEPVGPDVNKFIAKRTAGNKQQRIKPLSVLELSGTGAPVMGNQQTDTIFPVDAAQQSVRVSVFDKRGNAKTISLPSVSFGSQRVVPTAASYAPKGVW